MAEGLESSLQIFPSSKIEETARFYESIGFRAVSYLEAQQPHVCLYRGGVEIILTRSQKEQIVPNRVTHGYGYDAYFISSEQKKLQEEFRHKGVKIVKELSLTDYANHEFIFEDNEGRWVAVGRKEGQPA
jgi:hypothetical protein